MQENKSKKIGMVIYADDGILYSYSPFTPKPPLNQQFHEEKVDD